MVNLKEFKALGYKAYMLKKYRNRKYIYAEHSCKPNCIIIYTKDNVYTGSIIFHNKAQAKKYNNEESNASGTIYSRKEARNIYPELFK